MFCIPLRAAGARHWQEQEPRHGADLTLMATRETERNRQRAAFGSLQVTRCNEGEMFLPERKCCDGEVGSAGHTCSQSQILGWGQLDGKLPHTHPYSQGQRFPGQSVTPALLSQLLRLLCRVWLSQNSSCKRAQKWPREPPKHVLPHASLAGCPVFSSDWYKPSCTVIPSRSLSGHRVISQR